MHKNTDQKIHRRTSQLYDRFQRKGLVSIFDQTFTIALKNEVGCILLCDPPLVLLEVTLIALFPVDGCCRKVEGSAYALNPEEVGGLNVIAEVASIMLFVLVTLMACEALFDVIPVGISARDSR